MGEILSRKRNGRAHAKSKQTKKGKFHKIFDRVWRRRKWARSLLRQRLINQIINPSAQLVLTRRQMLHHDHDDQLLLAVDRKIGRRRTRPTNWSKRPERASTRKIDDNASMRQFNSWYPDEATRKMILVDNPVKLYGFPAAAA